jgi:hypothetical protein
MAGGLGGVDRERVIHWTKVLIVCLMIAVLMNVCSQITGIRLPMLEPMPH